MKSVLLDVRKTTLAAYLVIVGINMCVDMCVDMCMYVWVDLGVDMYVRRPDCRHV